MKHGFWFKSIRVVIVLAIAVAIAMLLIINRPKAQRQERTETGRLVEVFPAASASIEMLVEAYGTVQPRDPLRLVAEVPGKIVKLHPVFQEGGLVPQGEVILQVDPRTYQLQVEQRRVHIDQTRAELKKLAQDIRNLEASKRIAISDKALAYAEYQRLQKLIKNRVVAQTTVDQAEQKYLASVNQLQSVENQMALTGPQKEQLEAQLAMAKVSLRQAQLDLERSTIQAPFAARVLSKTIETGQLVVVGQEMGRVYRDGALDIEVRIPVKDLKWFPDQANGDELLAAEVLFERDGVYRTWQGRVARSKAQMDAKTRTLPLVVEVDQREDNGGSDLNSYLDLGRLRPGMFVTVDIKGKTVDQVHALPRHVVHDGDVIYVVLNNRLKVRPVNVIRRFKDTIYVDHGVLNGDLIVSTPLSGAVNGMLVRIKTEDK